MAIGIKFEVPFLRVIKPIVRRKNTKNIELVTNHWLII
jgi:hypothetical protein